MRHHIVTPPRLALSAVVLAAFAAVIGVSVLLVTGCGNTVESVEARAAQRVTAAHPEDPAAYLPDVVPGWTLESVPDASEHAPEGMRIAASVMVPETPAEGSAPVVLSAIVFDESLSAEAALLPATMGESATKEAIEGETVWVVESEPGTCAAVWMAAADTLVVTANGTCGLVKAAMAAVLAQ